MNQDLLTAEEVAKMLRVSPAYVLQHSNGSRRDPHIPSVKFGEGRNAPVRFRREDIAALIAGCVRGAA